MNSTKISAYYSFYHRLLMRIEALTCLRMSMGVVFVWFGALKLCGNSPAENLANNLVVEITAHAGWSHPLFVTLALMEVAIGVFFLFRRTLGIATTLLFVQMPLTFLPLVFLSKSTFVSAPFVPSLEGQYIIKNLVLLCSGILLAQSAAPNTSSQL